MSGLGNGHAVHWRTSVSGNDDNEYSATLLNREIIPMILGRYAEELKDAFVRP